MEQRIEAANIQAADAGLDVQTVHTPFFPLYTAQRFSDQSPVLTVVIEGDGYAFVERGVVSNNPTPLNPVGLKIATAFPGNVAYIGRPCQYISIPKCTPHMWTDQRFAPSVLQSFETTLNQLKAQSKASHFRLIGYSGGGYIAMRLAAARDDVTDVFTVAGLLDPQAWRDHHGLTMPIHAPDRTPVDDTVSYMHFCGEEDDVIPCALAYDFAAQNPQHRVKPIAGADHGDIWAHIPASLYNPAS